MSPISILKALVISLVLGLLGLADATEARTLNAAQQVQDLLSAANDLGTTYQQLQEQAPSFMNAAQQQQLKQLNEQLDSEDDGDDGDDDVAALTPATLPNQQHLASEQPISTSSNLQNMAQYAGAQLAEPSYVQQQQQQQPAASPSDLNPAASKHYHHKHGAKGWLDMGAWTGKKGSFGWYDKHPVGKGK